MQWRILRNDTQRQILLENLWWDKRTRRLDAVVLKTVKSFLEGDGHAEICHLEVARVKVSLMSGGMSTLRLKVNPPTFYTEIAS